MDVLYVFQSRLFLAAYCCFICLFVCLFVWFLNNVCFPYQSLVNLLSFFSPTNCTHSLICSSLPPLPVLLSVVSVVFPLTCFLFHSMALWLSAVNFSFFHSSHPLFISSSLLLGSLLTLLNVRAQTSPCRAAPSHRGQKQLVSLPFPCFLAASVCLTVCLLASALSSPLPLIHCLSQVGV